MQNTKIIKIRPKNFLAQEEINKLAKLHKQISNKKADRIKVVLLYNAGFTHKIIAMIMQVTEETIRTQLHEYEEKKKLDLASGGSKSNLNKEQTQQLISHLKNNTYLYVKDIVAYVQKIYSISYSLSGMRHWLYHNNFRYKKPHGVICLYTSTFTNSIITI